MSSATRVAGGSITVRDRTSSGRFAAASSEITPPYEWTLRVRLEVDPVDRWIRRESWTVENDELEALCKRQLRTPGHAASDDAAVHEHEALHRRILDLQQTGSFLPQEAEMECYKLAGMLRSR